MSGRIAVGSDDQLLWNLHLSAFSLPALTAADELGVFESLAAQPACATELAERLRLNRRAMRALLPLLASEGLLVQRHGRYHLTDATRDHLLASSPQYWGPVLATVRSFPMSHARIVEAMTAPEPDRWGAPVGHGPADGWIEGNIDRSMATKIAAYMHANAVPSARVAAQRVDLSKAQRLLDVGAGSGVFAIAFAQANPHLSCTLMDLQTMCDVAMKDYVRATEVAARIDARAVDMFRQPLPQGYDTLFFSNIFHDWDFETGRMLAAKAFAALPAGGRILLHEMLLDDTHDGPPVAVRFSFYMMLGTKGQQFTAAELSELLFSAGFVHVQLTPCHGDFAVVAAEKPA